MMTHDTIPSALAGERLDRIVSLMTDRSRADAAALVAAGGAAVDGTVVTSGKLRLVEGQDVVIDSSFFPEAEVPQPETGIAYERVFVDDHLVVVNKPAGLVVHPGAGNTTGTLVNALLADEPAIATIGEPHRPGIVHRLDVGTSGLMVVAKSQLAYIALVDALSRHDVQRTYTTLVWGALDNPVGVIDAPIGRDHRDPMRMAVVVDGKTARTHYRVLREARSPLVSLLECQLETGRTHQIRVHLAAIGHPVVGDGTYGGGREAIAVPRPFLHSSTLGFVHPVTHQPLSFTAPLPADLTAAVADLDFD